MRMQTYPRKPQSGKQAGRYRLPSWLRDGVDELLRVHLAVGIGRAELAVPIGLDVDDRVATLVTDASPELRARCREYLLGHALAPHAQWAADEHGQTPTAIGSTWRQPTVAELEERLADLAEGGDRASILAMLAALDPARYGPPGKTVPPPDTAVDTVDFAPAIIK
jgi:hypothetical protein